MKGGRTKRREGREGRGEGRMREGGRRKRKEGREGMERGVGEGRMREGGGEKGRKEGRQILKMIGNKMDLEG